ncbi:MAG: hypothetical protein JWO19_1945 [Bryobacterales bacterium]|nr:hypothetical protein [Bryobacterales bacterium]
MTAEHITGQSKAAAKALRAEKRAKAEAERVNAMEEQRNLRTQQLESVRAAVTRVDTALKFARKNIARCDALTSHLAGFYQEIDKLAKGKAMLEVTHLVVEQSNHIVRDAKGLIEGDIYLDRVKEFVPAGDNPVYPDVLVTLRSVQQSLQRFDSTNKQQLSRLGNLLSQARTIEAALDVVLSQDATEEEEYPSKADLEETLGHSPFDSWIKGDYAAGFYFDLDRLDRITIEEYFATSSDHAVESENEEDQEADEDEQEED